MMKKTTKTTTYTGYNNRPYKLPPPEEIIPDVLMAFTYNPSFTPMEGEIIDMPTYVNELTEVFRKLKYCKIHLAHEISSTGKFHLHGYIKIQNPIKFTLFDFYHLKQDGVLEIDTINDSDVWHTYVYKQKTIMTEFLKEQKVPYEINTIDSKLYTIKIDPLLKMRKCKRVELPPLEEYIEQNQKPIYIIPDLSV